MQKSLLSIVGSLCGLMVLGAVPLNAAPLSDADLAGLDQQSSTTFDEVYVHLTRLPLSLRSVDVSIAIDDARLQRQLGTRDLERLRASFERDLGGKDVDQNGTVSLEISLTELVPNRVLSHSGGRTASLHSSTGIGAASMEAVFRNASTGEILMVIRDRRTGLGLYQNQHLQSQRIWGDADEILEDWAAELPNAL